MVPKTSLFKKVVREKHEIQLGLEIEDNNNAINICE